MKLNKIFFLFGVAALSFMTSCGDDDYSAGEPATGNQLQSVTFGDKFKEQLEIDPAEPTTYTITVSRDAAYATEAASVPVKVLINTDNVYEVPSTVNFEAGKAEANLTVSYPKAEIGKEYKLEVALDDSYANPYKSQKTYLLAVTRVKWNDLGIGIFSEEFLDGKNGYFVKIQQKDTDKNMYRVINPYASYEGLKDAAQTILFTVLKDGGEDEKYGKFNYVSFETWSTGYYYKDTYLTTAVLPSSIEEDGDTDCRYYRDKGIIVLTPYFWVADLGGGFGAYKVYITMPNESIVGAVEGEVTEFSGLDSDEEEEEEDEEGGEDEE